MAQTDLDEALAGFRVIGDLLPGIVLSLQEKSARVYTQDGYIVEVDWDGLSWARGYIDESNLGPPVRKASDVLAPGDIVYLQYVDAEPAKSPEKEAPEQQPGVITSYSIHYTKLYERDNQACVATDVECVDGLHRRGEIDYIETALQPRRHRSIDKIDDNLSRLLTEVDTDAGVRKGDLHLAVALRTPAKIDIGDLEPTRNNFV